MEHVPIVIAVDWDGTVVTNDYPKMGEFLPGAVDTINWLYDRGDYIIIWTCRYLYNDIADMKQKLKSGRIKYHCINQNHPSVKFHPWPKIYADVYIDDRNLGGFPGWNYVREVFE